MSEQIPESIPTSMDPKSRRATKKRALSPTSLQSSQITSLFKKPDRPISIDAPRPKSLAPPPEIVANVQGSSAGAGSGEFHVYKASRRRENERVKMMEEELRREKEKEEFEQKAEELKRRDAEKTERNRRKRNKKKGKGEKEGKEGVGSPVVGDDAAGKNGASVGNGAAGTEQKSNTAKATSRLLNNNPAAVLVVEGNGLIIHDDSE